ncbi:MAG TPA: phenylalanine--tRNA ligase subunit alpha [Flavobacteriales bacterium]|nr:phenylalanine--tRNA ligase subunit alpha [Flavobacteriales bacterium]HIN39294.1 phenylalanine--tRNA ligase subunit alpha [Flavobacteriales bacterium]
MEKKELDGLLKEISSFSASNSSELEEFRIKFLGKKGIIRGLFTKLKDANQKNRKEFGQLINNIKERAESKFAGLNNSLAKSSSREKKNIDLSMPGVSFPNGSRHPISLIRAEMCGILERIGFVISEGPEIESDWHNFTALNIPEYHPARDMQDTFFIQTNPDILLRTHTSPQQIRVMESSDPPIRIICPGRVYRNETISARSHCIFHQIEGLYIDLEVSFADLKQTLYYFAQALFGDNTKIRFRPSYFPFTEPSAEMDISCLICKGNGCSVCKHSGWVEILGCGMVDPAVLDNCNIDSTKYTGYAFGLGIERPAMLKYQIDDIRLFFENDRRFLDQFKTTL